MVGWNCYRRAFAACTSAGVLLASGSAAAARPKPRDVGCATSCRLLLEPGSYRLSVEPSPVRRGGARSLEIAERGVYRVEAAPRSQRHFGLALASLGLPIAFGGAGAIIGSADLDEPRRSAQRAWFWGGAAAFGVGATLVPLGFRLYAARPSVEREPPRREAMLPPPPPAARVSLPSRPHRDDAVPDGYTLVDEPRWGLVTSGALTLAGSYAIMVASAAGFLASESDEAGIEYFFIPIVGPALYDAQFVDSDDRGGWTLWGSGPQAAGLVLLLIGATSSHSWLARSTASEIAPWFTGDAGGVSLRGALW